MSSPSTFQWRLSAPLHIPAEHFPTYGAPCQLQLSWFLFVAMCFSAFTPSNRLTLVVKPAHGMLSTVAVAAAGTKTRRPLSLTQHAYKNKGCTHLFPGEIHGCNSLVAFNGCNSLVTSRMSTIRLANEHICPATSLNNEKIRSNKWVQK